MIAVAVAEDEPGDAEDPRRDLEAGVPGKSDDAEHEARARRTSAGTWPTCRPRDVEALHAGAASRCSTVPPKTTSRTRTSQTNHSGPAPSMMIAAEADDEQQPVGRRVEDLAELAHLVEAAGEPAVDPVGGAEPAEQPRRAGPVVAAEEQVEEQRDAHSRTSVNTFGAVRIRCDDGPGRPADVGGHRHACSSTPSRSDTTERERTCAWR